jgi:hypothetical protein
VCHPHRDRGEEAGVSSDTEQKVSCSSSSSSTSPLHRPSGPCLAPVQRRRLRTPVWARSLLIPTTPLHLYTRFQNLSLTTAEILRVQRASSHSYVLVTHHSLPYHFLQWTKLHMQCRLYKFLVYIKKLNRVTHLPCGKKVIPAFSL